MTKKDYIALVKEFNLTYYADTTSAYFNEYPICGYRTDAPILVKMIGIIKV